MNLRKPSLALLVAALAAVAHAADRGVYTIVEGDARVLRGVTWYALAEGARAEEGDVIDVAERGQVQLEVARGGTLRIDGPALAQATLVPAGDDKATVPAEITLLRGWFKAAVPAKARPLRLRAPTAAVDLADGVIVLHDSATLFECFVESGRATVAAAAARGKDAVPRTASEGEFSRRAGERALASEDRPPADFIAAIPHDLRDALPTFAGRRGSPPPVLAAGRGITFAEAEPWLAGASRRAFIRRLTPRLADPEFRAAADARRIPEWDRILHPERYRPKPGEPEGPPS